MENGPFIFDSNSTNFTVNPYAWNKNANLFYLESPPGVGYSNTDSINWDDNTTAIANL